MADDMTRKFMLGDCLIEPESRQVSRNGSVEHLEPRTMSVLLMLCHNANTVVSTDDIIDEVWHGRPMGDNPVYKAIARLRQVLGDDSRNPRVIITVPKKGYRLAIEPRDLQTAPAKSPMRELAVRAWPVVAGIIAGIVVAALLIWRPGGDPPAIELVSTFAGSHEQPSFAPDGESFAFVSDAGDSRNIWILDGDAHEPRQLTQGSSAAVRPRWSPTGETILFQRSGSVWAIPASGGASHEILRDAYNPNWSHDGTRIVFERRYEIWTARADGSEQSRVEGIPRRELPLASRWPAFAPDGRRIVLFESASTPLGDLVIVNLADGTLQRLTDAPALGGAPVWSSDGGSIIYSSRRGGSRTLWRVDAESGLSEPILTGAGDDDFPDISPDGASVAYTNSRELYQVVETDPETRAERILYDSRLPMHAPELSPDGKQLALFGGVRLGGIQVFLIPMNGDERRLITSDPRSLNAIPRWSGDGRSIYFYNTRDDDAYARVDTTTGEQEIIVAGWNWNIANGASVSPDGSSVIYSRLTGQAPVQTSVMDLGSRTVATFFATLEYPRWSKNGRYVVGSRFIDQRFPGDVAVCDTELQMCEEIAADARIPVYSVDEEQIYFVRGFGRAQDVFVKSSDGGGEERFVMSMSPLHPLGPFYDVTADGRIIWVRHTAGKSDIWRIELP